MKQNFTGYLTQYTGDARDNVAVAKIAIKCKEMSAVKAVLSPFQDADDGINGAYAFVKSNGYGNAKFGLIDALPLHITFDTVEFDAELVSISVKKKQEADGGDTVEYCFNLEKSPTADDVKLWVSYLKNKSVDESSDEVDENTVMLDDGELNLSSNPKKNKKKKKKATIVEYNISFESIE